MALLTSPRKQTIPLASGDDDAPTARRRRDPPAVTKRVFFASVVVENPPENENIPLGALHACIRRSHARIAHATLQKFRIFSRNSATHSISMTSPQNRKHPSRAHLQTSRKPYDFVAALGHSPAISNIPCRDTNQTHSAPHSSAKMILVAQAIQPYHPLKHYPRHFRLPSTM